MQRRVTLLAKSGPCKLDGYRYIHDNFVSQHGVYEDLRAVRAGRHSIHANRHMRWVGAESL